MWMLVQHKYFLCKGIILWFFVPWSQLTDWLGWLFYSSSLTHLGPSLPTLESLRICWRFCRRILFCCCLWALSFISLFFCFLNRRHWLASSPNGLIWLLARIFAAASSLLSLQVLLRYFSPSFYLVLFYFWWSTICSRAAAFFLHFLFLEIVFVCVFPLVGPILLFV